MTYLKAVRSQCTFLRNLIRSFFIFCYNILNVTVSLGILILLSWGFYPAVKHSFPTEDSKLLSRFLQSHQNPLTRIVISPRRTMELLIYRCLKPLVWGIVSLLEGFILIHLMCSSTRVAQCKISILSLWLAWKWAIFFIKLFSLLLFSVTTYTTWMQQWPLVLVVKLLSSSFNICWRYLWYCEHIMFSYWVCPNASIQE